MFLRRRTLAAIAVLGLLTIITTLDVSPAVSQDDAKKQDNEKTRNLDQSAFMRKKLDASAQILEGLTTEDAQLVAKGAKALAEMSQAEKWKVRTDMMYRQFSGEFQRSAKAIVEAAEKENFDAAALKWMDTTMKCLECHKFVRGMRLASGKP